MTVAALQTVRVPGSGRDRLREFLDALLDGTDDGRGASLESVAGAAACSPFHFSRVVSRRAAGESPMSMRRRVLLERAAWQLLRGSSVTDAAFTAGYDSVDGFGRAFRRRSGTHRAFLPTAIASRHPWHPLSPARRGLGPLERADNESARSIIHGQSRRGSQPGCPGSAGHPRSRGTCRPPRRAAPRWRTPCASRSEYVSLNRREK